MKDQFNRNISYMRISLTDRCNFRCRYCMPSKGVEKLLHEDILSLEEVLSIVKVAVGKGIKKIRLTGGEPLLRKGVLSLCNEIAKEDIEKLCITTNGHFLEEMASDLKKAGVSGINISLDTLDSDKFKYITRNGKLSQVLSGLDTALKLGFQVKINCVLVGGFNTNEIQDLISLTKHLPIELRFIELMRMGETSEWKEESFVKNILGLEEMPQLRFLYTKGTAVIYQRDGYLGRIGLISPVSSCFCESCDRIRLTSDGRLKPCLHSREEIDLKGLSQSQIQERFCQSVFYKPKSHNLVYGNTDTSRTMNRIGG